MSNSRPESITQPELTRALRTVTLPDQAGLHFFTIPEITKTGAEHIAAALFDGVGAQREEKTTWVTGALYASFREDAQPAVYRREDGGWWSYTHRRSIPDEDFNPSNLQRLITETER